MLAPGAAAGGLQGLSAWFLARFGWLVLGVATGCLILCAVLAASPIGRRRIGGTETPEFRTVTWLAMLFAAGMGSGLVFWGAAEPLIHAGSPPPGGPTPGTPEAVRLGLAITQFHWSLHAWAIYAVAALAVALAARPGAVPLPSAPLALPRGARRVLDWTALVAVLFGIVASMGQALFQMGAGVEVATGGVVRDGTVMQAAILAVLLAAYTASALSGLRRGIAVLSLLNVGLALGLMAFVLAMRPGAALTASWQSLAAYLAELPRLSLSLGEGARRGWASDWSLTYFLWWVAWTPFVGVFVARISRGRSVRGFVLGVVLVPSAATLLWFGVFGGAALSVQAGGTDLGVSDFATAPQATYALLAELPLARLTQGITLLVVFLFMVTSADSGAYVLGLFGRDGAEPGPGEKVYWGLVLAGLTGAAVLSAGGQAVTRSLAVAGAAPLTMLLIAQGASLVRRIVSPAGRG